MRSGNGCRGSGGGEGVNVERARQHPGERPGKPNDLAKLEQRLETAFEKAFGRHVVIIVRTAEDWLKLAAGNPFPADSAEAGDQVAVRVMRKPAPADGVPALQAYAAEDEKVASVGGDIWVVFSRERPTSRLLAAMNHKRLGIGTSRNWNTVRKLAEMVSVGSKQ